MNNMQRRKEIENIHEASVEAIGRQLSQETILE
jgi:hypothetical protein